MITTPNLGLTTFNTVTDASAVLVYAYVAQVSGSNPTQNLGIIDNFSGSVANSLNVSASEITLATIRANDTVSAVIQIVQPSGDVDKTTGSFVLICPSDINGMSLYRAQAYLNTPSPDGAYNFMIYNLTTSASMIESASPILIATGNLVGTPGTIKSTSASVVTDNRLLIYTSASPATAGLGWQVVLEFIST